jgi:hypothetical protein
MNTRSFSLLLLSLSAHGRSAAAQRADHARLDHEQAPAVPMQDHGRGGGFGGSDHQFGSWSIERAHCGRVSRGPTLRASAEARLVEGERRLVVRVELVRCDHQRTRLLAVSVGGQNCHGLTSGNGAREMEPQFDERLTFRWTLPLPSRRDAPIELRFARDDRVDVVRWAIGQRVTR